LGRTVALAALGRSANREPQADRLELTGRLELLEGLALAAAAAERAGLSADAADLYFRAGRSAEVERDRANARRWLGAAARLAETTGQAAILADANERLDGLAEAERR
jgi:TPR repeat protein